MYYIKFYFLAVVIFLSACSTTADKSPTIPDNGDQPAAQISDIAKTSKKDIATYRLAITELHNGNLEEAKSILYKFIKDRPELAGPWANLGLIYFKQKNLEKAFEYTSNALERNPDMPQALNLMGQIENTKGNVISAKTYFTKAIKLKPDYAIAHYNLALLYDIYLQDIQNALVHYKRYLMLINNSDKETADWVEQLQLSMKNG